LTRYEHCAAGWCPATLCARALRLRLVHCLPPADDVRAARALAVARPRLGGARWLVRGDGARDEVRGCPRQPVVRPWRISLRRLPLPDAGISFPARGREGVARSERRS